MKNPFYIGCFGPAEYGWVTSKALMHFHKESLRICFQNYKTESINPQSLTNVTYVITDLLHNFHTLLKLSDYFQQALILILFLGHYSWT